ncbi:uncharacterized protein LOC119400419 [Rhipicephalus sanguineus]|nr:uncharacterized protein LOC119400419 [Rhipicephalus sanguineus]
MAANEPESDVQMRSREESQSFRARVQFRKSHSGPPKMEGYLRKRTAKLNLKWFWRKYWFVLDGRSLLYFKSQSNYNSLGTCKGLVDFGLVQAVRPSHGSKNTYAMEVITRSDVIHLAADDWQTRQVWVAALQAAIQISEVSWPFKVQLDNAPKLVQIQRGEAPNASSASDSEGRHSRHNDRRRKTSSLIIYENVSIETPTRNNESSSDRRPSSEGAIYQQISEAELKAHDCEPRTSDCNAFGKDHPCSQTKKDKGYGGMLRRARSFSCGLMSAKGRLPGFHRHRDKSSKRGSKDSPSQKHDSTSGSPAPTPDSNRVSKEARTASHRKQDSDGSVRSAELFSRQTSNSSNRTSHKKQGSTGSAKLDVTMPAAAVRNRIASSSSRTDEHRITACLDVNPTYQTAAESRADGFATEPATRKRYDSSSCRRDVVDDDDFAPECPSRPHPASPMPRSDASAPMPSFEYEHHVPPSLMGDKVGDDERQRKKPPNLRMNPMAAMIPNREYAEVYEDHVLPSPLRRSADDATRRGTTSMGHTMIQAPSSEYAEIDEGDGGSSLSRTLSSPPCSGRAPLARRPSNPESSVSRKTSKDSADDSSLHIYQEVRGLSRSPSPSPRTVFMASLASSTRPAEMDDEEESYYSSISEEDLRRYQWSSDLARVGETSETGTESSTYNTADASGSSEALAETGYMEDNPHITVTTTDSNHSSGGSSGGRIDTAPPSEAMRELRELLDCLGTDDDGNMLTGQRSIARARQLLVREMATNEA